MGFFDPVGFSSGKSDEVMYHYREAELKHGRIAMAATLGWIAQPVRERTVLLRVASLCDATVKRVLAVDAVAGF